LLTPAQKTLRVEAGRLYPVVRFAPLQFVLCKKKKTLRVGVGRLYPVVRFAPLQFVLCKKKKHYVLKLDVFIQ
jgi:hypothetical protein